MATDTQKAQFVQSVLPAATAAGKQLGVDPKVLIAQAALESNWGTSSNGNNLFGIKADSSYSGPKKAKKTTEYVDSKPTTTVAKFRNYSDPNQSFQDYANFIQNNPRYKDALASDNPTGYITGLQSAGYASDPNYAAKVIATMNSIPSSNSTPAPTTQAPASSNPFDAIKPVTQPQDTSIQVRMPDGNVVKVPAGTTQSQALAMYKQYQAKQNPPGFFSKFWNATKGDAAAVSNLATFLPRAFISTVHSAASAALNHDVTQYPTTFWNDMNAMSFHENAAGQNVSDVAGYPFKKLSEAGDAAGSWYAKKFNSPLGGAFVTADINALGFLLGDKVMRYAPPTVKYIADKVKKTQAKGPSVTTPSPEVEGNHAAIVAQATDAVNSATDIPTPSARSGSMNLTAPSIEEFGAANSATKKTVAQARSYIAKRSSDPTFRYPDNAAGQLALNYRLHLRDIETAANNTTPKPTPSEQNPGYVPTTGDRSVATPELSKDAAFNTAEQAANAQKQAQLDQMNQQLDQRAHENALLDQQRTLAESDLRAQDQQQANVDNLLNNRSTVRGQKKLGQVIKGQSGAIKPDELAKGIQDLFDKVNGARQDFKKAVLMKYGPQIKPYTDALYTVAATQHDKQNNPETFAAKQQAYQDAGKATVDMLANTPKVEGKSNGYNLNDVASGDDVHKVLDQAAEAYKKRPVSVAETHAKAVALGFTPEDTVALDRALKLVPQRVDAAMGVMQQKGEQIVAAAERYAQTGNEEDLATIGRLHMQQDGAFNAAFGVRSSLGRSLNMLKQGNHPASKVASVIFKAYGSQANLKDIAKAITDFKGNPEALAKFLRETAHKPTLKDAFFEHYVVGLLWSPFTQGANFMGNTLWAALQIPQKYIEAIDPASPVHFNEANRFAYQFLKAWPDAIRAAGRTWKSGEGRIVSGENDYLDQASKIEIARHRAISRRLLPDSVLESEKIMKSGLLYNGIAKALDKYGSAYRTPGDLLYAADSMAKTVAFNMKAHELAMRDAMQAYKEGRISKDQLAAAAQYNVNNLEEGNFQSAMDFAHEATFTNQLGRLGRDVQNFSNNHWWAKIFLPFVRVAGNITHRTIELVPGMNLGLSDYRTNLKAESPYTRSMARAQMYLGSGIAAGAVALASNRLITGGVPNDPGLKSTFYSSGRQPYSLIIGNHVIPLNRFGPPGVLLGLYADLYNMGPDMESGDLKKVATALATAAGNVVINQTYLKSLSDLFLAVNDFQHYGYKLNQVPYNITVPASRGVAYLAGITDPYLRQARGLLEAYKKNIPGYSSEVPAVRNIYGEPVMKSSGIGGVLPIYYSTLNHDPAIEQLYKLQVGITPPSRTLGGIKLNDKQYTDLQMLTGKYMKMLLYKVINTPAYRYMNAGRQRYMLKMAASEAKKFGTQMFYKLHKEILLKQYQNKRDAINATK